MKVDFWYSKSLTCLKQIILNHCEHQRWVGQTQHNSSFDRFVGLLLGLVMWKTRTARGRKDRFRSKVTFQRLKSAFEVKSDNFCKTKTPKSPNLNGVAHCPVECLRQVFVKQIVAAWLALIGSVRTCLFIRRDWRWCFTQVSSATTDQITSKSVTEVDVVRGASLCVCESVYRPLQHRCGQEVCAAGGPVQEIPLDACERRD